MQGSNAISEICLVTPFRCRVWTEHARLEECLTENTCHSEIQSLRAHGQLIPALGRRVYNDPLHDVEIVCGARRLFAARHLNVPLKVQVVELSDREAAVALDIENNQRQHISQYERARGYAQWLKNGMFGSQDELARAIGISKAQMSRLLTLARLPSVIVNAFSSPHEIRETWAPDLDSAWRDPKRRLAMTTRARRLAKLQPRARSAEAFHELLSRTPSMRTGANKARDEVMKDANGMPVFRVRFRRKFVAILLPQEIVSGSLDCVTAAVLESLEQTPRVPEVASHQPISRTVDNAATLAEPLADS